MPQLTFRHSSFSIDVRLVIFIIATLSHCTNFALDMTLVLLLRSCCYYGGDGSHSILDLIRGNHISRPYARDHFGLGDLFLANTTQRRESCIAILGLKAGWGVETGSDMSFCSVNNGQISSHHRWLVSQVTYRI